MVAHWGQEQRTIVGMIDLGGYNRGKLASVAFFPKSFQGNDLFAKKVLFYSFLWSWWNSRIIQSIVQRSGNIDMDKTLQ